MLVSYLKYLRFLFARMHGFLVPRQFFITSGVAHDGSSLLNAFDLALEDAAITQCNLVEVSSILPPDSEEIQPIDIPAGAITFCVMAKMAGTLGERIGSGLAWAWGELPDGNKYGIVAGDRAAAQGQDRAHGRGPRPQDVLVPEARCVHGVRGQLRLRRLRAGVRPLRLTWRRRGRS